MPTEPANSPRRRVATRTLGAACALLTFSATACARPSVRPSVRPSATAAASETQPGEVINVKDNRSEALKAIRQHLDLWRAEWKHSEHERSDADSPRGLFWHCHAEDVRFDRKNPRVIQYHQRIPSLYSAFAVCPSWLLSNQPVVKDEAIEADAPISEARRAKVQASREELVRTLDAAAQKVPTDEWLAGQLVRFRLEQSRYDEALAAARNCRPTGSDGWRCLALVGLVESRRRNVTGAGEAFAAARALMSMQQRCEWDDIVALLPFGERTRYSKETCARRDLVNQRYWWLSDPLFVEPGNERHVADGERKMLAILRADVVRDERFDWQIRSGGDAMTELVQRYGWPSYTAWGGQGEDELHGSYLEMMKSRVRPPYTTFEYTRGRLHTAPAWEVVHNPFSATITSWSLNEPRDSSDIVWWPEEHFARPRPLLQLTEGQTALFRRLDGILVATAHAITKAQRDSLGGASLATLVTSPQPSRLTIVDRRPLRDGQTAMLRGLVSDSASVIASVEMVGAGDSTADARIRFAITPPTALRSLPQGGLALSDPILTRVPPNTDALATLGDSLIDQMLGTTTLRADTRRVGVYWESYGFRIEDSVRIAVRVDRYDDSGFLRRLGAALNLVGDPQFGIEISWQEPDVPDRARALDAFIQSRALVLDMTSLVPGRYELIVSVTKRSGESVASSRTFHIR